MKNLTLQEFVSQASPDDCRIFHVGDGHWEVRCHSGVLAKPSGKTQFDDLVYLLSILAGVGIRCCDIEWDGLPARQLEMAETRFKEICESRQLLTDEELDSMSDQQKSIRDEVFTRPFGYQLN